MPTTNTYSDPHNLFSVPDITPEKYGDKFSGHGDIPVYLPAHYSHFDAHELIAVASALVNPRGRGIYATDEAPLDLDGLLDKTSHEVGVPVQHLSDEAKKERRKQWRCDVYNSISNEHISGIILHAESLHDFNLGPLLSSKGIIPGIRANGELTPIPRAEHEFIVQGLDGLLGKLQAARALGARFSKWRAPIACSSHIAGYPTSISLQIQAETLAQFAAVSQQAGLVPIVEPDVDFSRDADLSKSVHVHEAAISMIYERMKAHGVLLEGTLLKPSFPQPGLRNNERPNVTAEEIALATATMLTRCVPIAVAGVLFLSGGLSSDTATSYLSALNELVASAPERSALKRLPPLTFSFGRAIQGDALKCWVKGDKDGMKTMLAKWSKISADAANGPKVKN
ncbi:hypothetical protein CVT24_007271 [Panaeolus cyanescens]|uniref:Fructose-bisphosphate aldolase n=1 Tax=Panaeolus cyanescens TaxID=181874 RepID=A0A409VJ39_9AGAR|nr:hypothetical protein CVT24_007271 [Panaeolus cyanescens]